MVASWVHCVVQMTAHCLFRKMVPSRVHYVVQMWAHCLVRKFVAERFLAKVRYLDIKLAVMMVHLSDLKLVSYSHDLAIMKDHYLDAMMVASWVQYLGQMTAYCLVRLYDVSAHYSRSELLPASNTGRAPTQQPSHDPMVVTSQLERLLVGSRLRRIYGRHWSACS